MDDEALDEHSGDFHHDRVDDNQKIPKLTSVGGNVGIFTETPALRSPDRSRSQQAPRPRDSGHEMGHDHQTEGDQNPVENESLGSIVLDSEAASAAYHAAGIRLGWDHKCLWRLVRWLRSEQS